MVVENIFIDRPMTVGRDDRCPDWQSDVALSLRHAITRQPMTILQPEVSFWGY